MGFKSSIQLHTLTRTLMGALDMDFFLQATNQTKQKKSEVQIFLALRGAFHPSSHIECTRARLRRVVCGM